MPTFRSLAGSLVCWFSFAVFCAASAQGQAQRTFVSTSGSDANTALLCNSANPCRSFSAALTVTNPAGEVIALSSGGYGAFTVTQPVSIISPAGVYVGVSVFTGDGVTIDAPGATVILRGLHVNAQGSSGSGIQVDDVGSLHVESCVINGFSAATTGRGIQHLSSGALFVKSSILRNNYRGIFVAPASTIADFAIDDTHVKNNGEVGIFVIGGAGTITRSMASRSSHGIIISAEGDAAISDFTATRNGVGIVAQAGGRLTVRNSTASQNITGFLGASGAELNIESCSSSGNDSGIVSTTIGTVVRVSNSVVTNNDTGYNQSNSGVLETRGNNTLRGNTTATLGTITSIGGG